MNTRETHTYLESLISRDFHLELTAIRDACRAFDDPQRAFPVVHIAGTNGKGSTAAFTSAILEANGYRVGLYTSPHLIRVTERIQINRRPIAEKTLAHLVTLVRERLGEKMTLGYFELLTLLGFLVFREQKIDIAVMETGLGGRLDATNVVEPVVTIITPISFDHQRYLGSTLTHIAREKCGIIKRGVPTVTALQSFEVMEVLRRACDDVGSALCVADPEDIQTPLGLPGIHQRQNAACAVEATGILSHAGFTVTNVDKALASTRWAGRLETLQLKPTILLDAAHNPAGSETLATYLHEHYSRERTVLVVGAFADKDIAGIIRPLVPHVREVICVTAPNPRAASPKDLAAAARSFGAKVTIEEEPVKALQRIVKTLKHDETLVVAGSTSVVGMAKQLFGPAKGKE